MEGIMKNALNDRELETVVGGISQDEALSKALGHAGFSRNQVDFIKKVELDYEHGRKVYEIEFYKGGYEYEYVVDAETGMIYKSKKDWD